MLFGASSYITICLKNRNRTLHSSHPLLISQTYFLDTHALSVEVKNVSGLLGENGTEIECSYSKENVFKIDVVYIVVFNRSSLQFQSIAEYFPNLNPTLTPPGQYLRGRVTLMGIAQSSMKVVLIFNKLMCIDETFYRCVVRFTDASLNRKEKTSSNMRISVQGILITVNCHSLYIKHLQKLQNGCFNVTQYEFSRFQNSFHH